MLGPTHTCLYKPSHACLNNTEGRPEQTFHTLRMTEPLHTSSNGGAERGPNAAFESEKTLQTTTRLQRFDSLHMEAGKIPGGQSHTAKVCSSNRQLNSYNSIHFFMNFNLIRVLPELHKMEEEYFEKKCSAATNILSSLSS